MLTWSDSAIRPAQHRRTKLELCNTMPPTSVNLGVSGVPLEDTYKDFDAPQIQSTTSKAKNCAECRRLKIKCDRKIP